MPDHRLTTTDTQREAIQLLDEALTINKIGGPHHHRELHDRIICAKAKAEAVLMLIEKE